MTGNSKALFHSPEVILFSADVERIASFYKRLGFRETFRVPQDDSPIHVDLELDGYKIGFSSIESSRKDHGLQPVTSGQRGTVTLWTQDTRSAYHQLLAEGVPGLQAPHQWLGRLLIAWVQDPDGHPIQIVQNLSKVSE